MCSKGNASLNPPSGKDTGAGKQLACEARLPLKEKIQDNPRESHRRIRLNLVESSKNISSTTRLQPQWTQLPVNPDAQCLSQRLN